MAKGWTVQVTTHDRGARCDRIRQQLFDVAIEDQERALEAVRHHVWSRPDAEIQAMGELQATSALSPGRVRCR